MIVHPFADLLNMQTTLREQGRSELRVTLQPQHLNPHGVVHGAVYFALADTGMGQRFTCRWPRGKSARPSRSRSITSRPSPAASWSAAPSSSTAAKPWPTSNRACGRARCWWRRPMATTPSSRRARLCQPEQLNGSMQGLPPENRRWHLHTAFSFARGGPAVAG